MARINEAYAEGLDRYTDLQVAVYLPDTDRPIFRVGGRWDATAKRFAGPAATECAVHLTRAQASAWRPIQEWLTRYLKARRAVTSGVHATLDAALLAEWDDRPPLFTLQLFGGRQGGKTHLAAVLVALVAVAIPGAACAIVSPIAKKTAEVLTILERFCLPAAWRQTVADEIRMINGSLIGLHTGRVSDLKAMGPIEIGLLNEAQEQPKRNWTDLQGNTIARAGLVVLAQNPPRTNKGEWTQELYNEVKAGEKESAACCWIKPQDNQFASDLAIRHLASTMSEKERKRDVDGDMGVAPGETALHEWSDSLHVIEWIPTTWVDVTPEVTRAVFGQAYERIGGLDWDKGAGPSYTLGRLFRPHNAPPWERRLVIEHGATLRGLAEEELPSHLQELTDKYGRRLFELGRTIWVGDSSGRFQSTKRTYDEDDHPSWARMQQAGFRLTAVDGRELRNPRRRDRFDLINSYVLGPKSGAPRVAMLAGSASEVIVASRKLPRRGYDASRTSRYAHLVDAWTYPAWRLFSVEYRDLARHAPRSIAREASRSAF